MILGFYAAGFAGMKLDELLRWGGGAGYQAIELVCFPQKTTDRVAEELRRRHAFWSSEMGTNVDVDALDEESADDILRRAAESGLAISALGFYANHLHPDPKERLANQEHLRRVIEAARLLGVPYVGTFAGYDPDLTLEENLNDLPWIWEPLLAYAEERGVKLMFENCPMVGWNREGIPGNAAYSPQLWKEIFDRIPSASLGLNFDPSHLHRYGIDCVAAAKEFAPRIFHVHAKDSEILTDVLGRAGYLGAGWARFRIPGQGSIDWTRLFSALHEGGYDGVVSVEHEDRTWHRDLDQTKRGFELALRYLKSVIV
jgi:sugar phosphate isomerase/epimerase